MKDGDVLQFDIIENKLSSKAELKGLAFHSQSIEKFQKLRDEHMFESDNLSLEHSQDIQGWDETTLDYNNRLEN